MQPGEILWTPGPERVRQANVTAFTEWLARERGRRFADYNALWRWSVEDLEGFWQALWDYFDIQSSAPHTRVLGRRSMPGAEWFPGARLNYAQHVLRREAGGGEALLYVSETRPLTALNWETLGNSVRTLATQLRALGVGPGDRVVAWMPNIPETMIAMLATTAIGAIWACCSPDFGERGTLDRLVQLSPKVLFAIDGYRYGGKSFDRRSELRHIAASLTSLEHIVYLPYLNPRRQRPAAAGRGALAHAAGAARGERGAVRVRAGALRSSAVDAVLLRHHRAAQADRAWPRRHPAGDAEERHVPLRPAPAASACSTSPPAAGCCGTSSPARRSPARCRSSMTATRRTRRPTCCGRWPRRRALRPSAPAPPTWISSAAPGSCRASATSYARCAPSTWPAPRPAPSAWRWFYANVKPDLWVANGSGGTDCCTGFVGGVPTLPVRAGEIQAPSLGVAVKAFNARGESVVDEVGELVITEPMPSMPLRFWNDPGDQRYLETYFQEFPGVWRHGDFFRINAQGGSLVLGRSDATLNRYGVRIGTAEIYRSLAPACPRFRMRSSSASTCPAAASSCRCS